MPCFSSGPTPGTREYDEWLPEVRRKLDSFTHVVDYYYGKAGMPMPQPTGPDGPRDSSHTEGASDAIEPVDPGVNARVLHQILLHLDCDDVDVFQLNDMRNLLWCDRTPKGRGYADVLDHCFAALRNGFRERPSNDAQWCECRNPALMLAHLRGKLSDRKLRLFAVACCRRASQLLTDEGSWNAVEVAERYADGRATVDDLGTAEDRAKRAWRHRRDTDSPAAWSVASSADEAARNAAWWACDNDYDQASRAQAALLRCISRNPFRSVSFTPSWRTDTAVALAHQMYDSRDFSAMPILADALQDAGCEDAALLDHCRNPNQVHTRGCWVLDCVLGKN